MMERIAYTIGSGIWFGFFTDKILLVFYGMSFGLLFFYYIELLKLKKQMLVEK